MWFESQCGLPSNLLGCLPIGLSQVHRSKSSSGFRIRLALDADPDRTTLKSLSVRANHPGAPSLLPHTHRLCAIIMAVPVAAAVGLAQVFAPDVVQKGIAGVVSAFDFSSMNVNDSSSDDYLHCDLAPSFGKLKKESLNAMDRELKVMITGTMRSLRKAREAHSGPLEWKTVMETLMQNTLIEPFENEISRSDKIIKEGTNFFKFDGSPDRSIVEEVNSWFVNFISDQDVLESTSIDINVVGRIVAQTGATVRSFETLFYKKEQHQKTLVDIGILRFPDIDRPYFQVYRIQLTAWSSSERITFVQTDKNGIIGQYNSRKFRPRKSVMDRIAGPTLDKAAEEALEYLPK
ncbi:hypothetical protein BD413DRAFT_565130 [Trametes elegans]|nr:hypothetical protein BD413DRAFT_565130 [Trametes elegans]